MSERGSRSATAENVMEEALGEGGTLSRDDRGGVVLSSRLRAALEKLNPGAPREAIKEAQAEGLTCEQLAIFDLLSIDGVDLGAAEREAVRQLVRELPKKLAPKLVIDWRSFQRTKAAVKTAIKDALDEGLPDAYDQPAYDKAVAVVYEHVYESYWGEGKSKYTEANDAPSS